ncbi:MAG: ABC transporter permease [Gammaproteobacteria bacterium]
MKYLHFVWSNLTRNRARLTFTLISIVSAFALYGMLAAISVFFQGADRFSDERVWIQSKYGGPLPFAHIARINMLPGIATGSADYGTGIGGYYQNPGNPVGPVAVSMGFSSEVDPTGRFVWKPEEFRAYQADRTGALVNENLVRLYGWKVGDVIPITVEYLPKVDGTRVWNFTVRGTFHYKDPAESPRQILFHHEYFDESRAEGRGTVGFIVAILEKGMNPAQFAVKVDELFMNSSDETSSGTQDALRRDYFKRIGNLSLIAYLILSAVFVSMLLVTGNSLMHSFAERTREIGTLKALGFQPGSISGLVIFESSMMMVVGGLFGLLIAWAVVKLISQRIGSMQLSGGQLALGLAIMLITGLITGLTPALKARRLAVVDALGSVRR